MLRGAVITSLLAFTACASLAPHARPPAARPAPPLEKATPAPAPEPEADAIPQRTLRVKASAFNSLHAQTDRTPNVGAWGDTLSPGMRAIAVSSDLLELGLDRGQIVRIDGLEGEYVVFDRMSPRWERKIDIYMGEDVRAARNWGIRDVDIIWTPDGN